MFFTSLPSICQATVSPLWMEQMKVCSCIHIFARGILTFSLCIEMRHCSSVVMTTNVGYLRPRVVPGVLAWVTVNFLTGKTLLVFCYVGVSGHKAHIGSLECRLKPGSEKRLSSVWGRPPFQTAAQKKTWWIVKFFWHTAETVIYAPLKWFSSEWVHHFVHLSWPKKFNRWTEFLINRKHVKILC